MFVQIKVVRETMNRALETWKEVTEDSPASVKSECNSAGKACLLYCVMLSSQVKLISKY